MKKLLLASMLIMLGACSTAPDYYKADLIGFKTNVGKCDYSGYTKIVPNYTPELIHNPVFTEGEVLFAGDNYNNSSCYGTTVVFKSSKDNRVYYYHNLRKLFVTKGQKGVIPVLGATKYEPVSDNYFYIKDF